MTTTSQTDIWTKVLGDKPQAPTFLTNQTLALNWDELGDAKLGTTILSTKSNLEDLSNLIIIEGLGLEYNVVVGKRYLEYLFKPVYFSDTEVTLGYTHRIKHFQLTQPIKYLFGLRKSTTDSVSTELFLAAKDIEDQILSNPSDFLDRMLLK